ncbi:MAG: DUF2975 domain-containing protein, partial [Clostridia bacterium]|nr:DUF2975 domain-containing protein [Clostridia bacterium]
LSLALTILFMIALICGVFIMPWLVHSLLELPDEMRDTVTSAERGFVLAVSYAILAVCAVADGMLFFLLLRVRRGDVFTARSVALIRGVSWCGILMGLLFAMLGGFFQLAFVMAFAGVFLGLCLRVVKNVIEEATEIKAENDLTV